MGKLVIILAVVLPGCAAPLAQGINYGYTAVNAGTTIQSNKGIPDHALSYIVEGDCNWMNVFKGLYYCEMPTYNQSGI